MSALFACLEHGKIYQAQEKKQNTNLRKNHTTIRRSALMRTELSLSAPYSSLVRSFLREGQLKNKNVIPKKRKKGTFFSRGLSKPKRNWPRSLISKFPHGTSKQKLLTDQKNKYL